MTNRNDAPPVIPADQEIVDTSIEHAASDEADALGDDDRSWIATVITSLEERSVAVKEALAQALLNGQNQQDQAAPLGCTISQKPLESEHLGKVSDSLCDTTVYHKAALDHGSTVWDHKILLPTG